MSFLDDWKEWSTTKKAISILVVCCIGLIIIGALTGGGSPDKNTAPTSDSSDNNTTTGTNADSTSNDTTTEATGIQVKITYSGDWSGAISTGGSTKSISGSGDETIDIEKGGMVSANAQKQDGSSNELSIQILKDGKVVEETSTDAEYGVAQVSGFV